MIKAKKRGITLIELIIALSILGIITTIVFSFFFSNKKTLDKVEVKTDLQYEAKEVMDKISKYAMEATKAEYKEGDLALVFTMVDNSEVIFKVKAGVSTAVNGKVVITGKELSFHSVGVSDTIICTSLKALTLYGDKDKEIKVKLDLEKSGVSYSVSDSFLFRNRGL